MEATDKVETTPWPNQRYAWYVVIVLNLAYGLAVLDKIIIGLMVDPIKQDLGLSDTQVGLLQGLAFAIFYTAFSYPIGYLVDRFNRVKILASGIVTWSAATFACGFAGSFGGMFAARVAVGIGEAVVTPASSSLVSDYFRPEIRAKAFSVLMLGGTFGTAMAYFLGGNAIQHAPSLQQAFSPWLDGFAGWQLVFLFLGVPGFLLSGLLLLTVHEPARRENLKKDSKQASLAETVRFLKANKGAYVTVIGGATLSVLVINAVVAWYPTIFIRVYGWTPAQVGTWFAIIGLCCGSFSAISGGWLISYFSKKGMVTAPIWAIFMQSLFWMVFGTAKAIAPTPTLSLIAHVGSGVSAVWTVTAVLTAINQITPNEMRGQVVAIYTILSGILGLTVGAASVGMLSDYVFSGTTSIAWALGTVIFVGSVFSMVFIVCGRKSFRDASLRAREWK